MIAIVFPDRDTERRALGFLVGRYSGRVFKFVRRILKGDLFCL